MWLRFIRDIWTLFLTSNLHKIGRAEVSLVFEEEKVNFDVKCPLKTFVIRIYEGSNHSWIFVCENPN